MGRERNTLLVLRYVTECRHFRRAAVFIAAGQPPRTPSCEKKTVIGREREKKTCPQSLLSAMPIEILFPSVILVFPRRSKLEIGPMHRFSHSDLSKVKMVLVPWSHPCWYVNFRYLCPPPEPLSCYRTRTSIATSSSSGLRSPTHGRSLLLFLCRRLHRWRRYICSVGFECILMGLQGWRGVFQHGIQWKKHD